jgi:MoxR-like ATPase
MQEREVTIAGVNYKLDYPFLVFATQNPIEHEGTYLLPEAQQDRFMFNIEVNYPNLEDEIKIVQETTIGKNVEIKSILKPKDLIEYQSLITKVPVSEVVIRYAVKFVHLTRPETSNLDIVKNFVKWGAGPRASQNLIIAAKTKALLEGRHHVSIDDINYLVYSILNHRVIVNYRARAEKIDSNYVIKEILEYMRKNDE